ncbi:MAG TPA: DUF3043 domain-containing protein [Pseudolysinimonas sp.]|nr:DUF3043 domain-containing protein [Pseudolysinimonas sp.]
MAKTPQSEPEPVADSDENTTKGRATPRRKEQEAARKRPLVPTDRREATRQSRAQTATERDRARIGLASGEEKYLPLRDKGPQKRFVRDYVDARFSIGELLLPMVAVTFLSYLLPVGAQQYAVYGVYVVILIVIADGVVLGFTLNRKLAAKFGATKVERIRWYAFMRAIQLRPLRLPKPQVKRGHYPS